MKKENDEQKNNNILLQDKLDAVEQINRTEPIFKEVEDVLPKEYVVEEIPLNKEYIGRWERVLMSINGIQEKFSPSTLEISDGFFIKTTNCVISGLLSVSEDEMIMSVTNDGCKEGKNNFVSTYKVSPDKNSLIFSIKDSEFEITEKYKRILTPVLKKENN
jgi:hypothetical protein